VLFRGFRGVCYDSDTDTTCGNPKKTWVMSERGSYMNVGELLAAVALRGITLEARGDRLRFRPRSAVTPEMLEQLKAHKPDLLAILEAEREAAESAWRIEFPPPGDGARPALALDARAGDCGSECRWGTKGRELVAWFLKKETRLPLGPFQLRPGVRVFDPARFYASLRADVEAGPSNARRAGLFVDLADLWTAAERGPSRRS
jgi:hypothetical protein